MDIFWLVLLLLLLITPLQFTLLCSHAARTEGTLTLRLWGLPRTIAFHVERTGQGHQLILAGRHVHPMQPRPDQFRSAMVSLGTFLRSDRAKRFFFQHVQLQDLSIALQLCLDNAARSAMYTGLLRTLYTLSPRRWRRRIRLRVMPVFLHSATSWRLRCILFTRLGTLVITAVMLLTAWMLERREHRSHRPKEERA